MLSLPYSHHRAKTLSGLFVIRKKDIDQWYFKIYEQTSISKITWVHVIPDARIFVSEEEVEEFKFHYLKNRKCDIIFVPVRSLEIT